MVRCGCLFKEGEISVSLLCVLTTHLWCRPQVETNRWSFRFSKQRAAAVVRQLHAAHAGRFAVRHAGDGRGYGRRDATGRAARTTLQRHVPSPATHVVLVVNPIPALIEFDLRRSDQRSSWPVALPRVQRIAQPISQQVKARHRERDAQSGVDG
jgi:hypothetical protein